MAQRMTRQRAAVLDAFEGRSDFRSAQQVHHDMVNEGTGVSLATVYRNLQVLEESGKLDAVRNADGEVVYRLCEDSGHHHHLVCEVCGEAEEVDLTEVEPFLLRAASQKGFQLTNHELELFGRCANCRKGQALDA